MISVIIPIYKSENFLRQTIDSVLNQSYSNLELVLVNDGSPDNSREICLSYANEDIRVVYLEQPNSGAAHAMRKGMESSRGEFIMFLDGDDWLELNTLEVAFEYINKNNPDIVFWNAIKEFPNQSILIKPFLDEDEYFVGEKLNWLKRRAFGLIGEELKNITKFDQISSGWGKIYKRELFENDKFCLVDKNNIGNFDTELVCRLFNRSLSIQYINKDFNHYRMYNDNSLTKTHGSLLYFKFKPMFLNLHEFINENNLSDDYKQALNNRISVSILNCLLSIISKRNADNFFKKYETMKVILNDNLYKNSIKNFEYNSVNYLLRFFFYSCRFRYTLLVLGLGYSMRFLKSK